MTSVKIEIIKIGESNKTHMNKRSSFIKDANSQTAQSNHTERSRTSTWAFSSLFFFYLRYSLAQSTHSEGIFRSQTISALYSDAYSLHGIFQAVKSYKSTDFGFL